MSANLPVQFEVKTAQLLDSRCIGLSTNRNAINYPTKGLIRYEEDTAEFVYYDGVIWKNLIIPSRNPPTDPNAQRFLTEGWVGGGPFGGDTGVIWSTLSLLNFQEWQSTLSFNGLEIPGSILAEGTIKSYNSSVSSEVYITPLSVQSKDSNGTTSISLNSNNGTGDFRSLIIGGDANTPSELIVKQIAGATSNKFSVDSTGTIRGISDYKIYDHRSMSTVFHGTAQYHSLLDGKISINPNGNNDLIIQNMRYIYTWSGYTHLDGGYYGVQLLSGSSAWVRVYGQHSSRFYGSHAYVNNSDDRLKFNEIDLPECLSIIEKLNPQIYDKSTVLNVEDDMVREAGYIAQEVAEIPELAWAVTGGGNETDPTTGEDKEQPFQLNYQAIEIYHLKATQELNEKVKKQASLITSLLNRIEKLESYV